MAAAIKTIRVRNSDGTYGDTMPIGADSNNVDIVWDGSNLTDVLGPVNRSQYGSIQEQLNTLRQKIENIEKILQEKGIS